MTSNPKALLKIDFGSGLKLGPGKIRLLELVAKTGSISAAARQMEMSYRRAWLLIDELNDMFGALVVEKSTGGSGGGGAKVTSFGQQVVAAFNEIENATNQLVAEKIAPLLNQG